MSVWTGRDASLGPTRRAFVLAMISGGVSAIAALGAARPSVASAQEKGGAAAQAEEGAPSSAAAIPKTLGGKESKLAAPSSQRPGDPDAVDVASLLPDDDQISASAVGKLVDAGVDVYILDVRTAVTYASAHIEGSVNIPTNRLEAGLRVDEVPPGVVVVVVSATYKSGRKAVGKLVDAGLDGAYIRILERGVDGWDAAGFELVDTSPELHC